MIAGFTYHAIQIIIALAFVFIAGVMWERRSPFVALACMFAGVILLLAEVTTFLALIGPLLRT